MSIINMPGTITPGHFCNVSFIFININFDIVVNIEFLKIANNSIKLLFEKGWISIEIELE